MSDRTRRWLTGAVAILAAASLTDVGQASGQEPAEQAPPSWSVLPIGGSNGARRAAFVYTLRPGQVFQDTVTVSNPSDDRLTLDLYATDAFNTPVDAGFALLQQEEVPTDAGSWAILAVDQVTLEPRTQAEVPFHLEVPLGATPGDHAAGIVAADVESRTAEPSGDVGVEVRQRVAARIYVRVQGPLTPRLDISSLDVEPRSALLPPLTGSGRATITFEIRNTGNVRLAPTAVAVVRGVLGRQIHEFEPRDLPELLPGSSVVVTEELAGLPPFERLTVDVDASANGLASDDVVTHGTTVFWAVSWLFVLVIVAGVGSAAWWWRRQRRRRLPKSRHLSHDRGTAELVRT